MPTYVYACSSCGERLEVVQRITDDALTICPNCEGALRKVMQPVGIVFKGSGFYKTDSRGASKSSSAASPASSESSSSSGDSSSSSSDASSSTTSGSGDSSSSGTSKPAAATAAPSSSTSATK